MENQTILTFVITDPSDGSFTEDLYTARNFLNETHPVVLHEFNHFYTIFKFADKGFKFRIVIHAGLTDRGGKNTGEQILGEFRSKEEFKSIEMNFVTRKPDWFGENIFSINKDGKRYFNLKYFNREDFIKEFLEAVPVFTKEDLIKGLPIQSKAQVKDEKQFDVAIISVIPKELEALKTTFGFGGDEPFINVNGIKIWKSKLIQDINSGRELNILHTMIGSAGNVSSSLVTHIILQNFKIKLAILCGIAAGNKAKTKVYSAVLGDKIVYYENQKLILNADPKLRIDPIPIDVHRGRDIPHLASDSENWKTKFLNALTRANISISVEETKDKSWITSNWQEELKIGEGVIVSGEKLFADGSTLEKLAEENTIGKYIIAGEMEGYGFARACIEDSHKEWLVVRGISDYGGPEKSDDVNDNYQIIAAMAASTLVEHYLKSSYTEIQPSKK
jgi:nucleoside phosphorylase